jgi:hypothetical protein
MQNLEFVWPLILVVGGVFLLALIALMAGANGRD